MSGKHDVTFPYEMTVPLVADIKSQMPTAMCDISPMNVAANVLMNPVPPFDDLEVRRALAMALDRKGFIDILARDRLGNLVGREGERRADLAGVDRNRIQVDGGVPLELPVEDRCVGRP